MITLPTEATSPSIFTTFVDGVKFDICEVSKSHYNLINDKRFRFFLCVDDNKIVGFDNAKKFCEKTGEDRWDMFCMSLQDCKDLIVKFQESHDSIIKLQERSKKSRSLEISCTSRIHSIKKMCIDIYGTYPTF